MHDQIKIVLKDKSIPNKKEVEKIPGVMGVNIAGGQYQVIIGNSVGNVYKEVVAATGISDTAVGGDAAEHIEKKLIRLLRRWTLLQGV